jgi:hypothetical protein
MMLAAIGVVALLAIPLVLGPCTSCRDGWRSRSSGGHGTVRGTVELIQTSTYREGATH